MTKPKNVGNSISAPTSGWSFSGSVNNSFDAHVEKSVPDYQAMHSLILKLSDFFVHSDSVVYDLGCSTGSLTKALGQRFEGSRDSARVIGVDIEPEMIDFALRRNAHRAVQYLACDILAVELEKSDLIVMNLTAQFIPPKNRELLMRSIWSALNWGGGLILFEKIRGSDARFHDIFLSIYRDFKEEQGFTLAEIASKEKALRGVMEPFSEKGNLRLLEAAGFEDIETVFRSIPFSGFLAIK